ncbi:MAG TPA: hypothetical protein VF198_15575 [Vicinamibacterales bacterium]
MHVSRMALAIAGLTAMVLAAEPAAAHPAWGLVVARDGSIYFSDVGRNVVWRAGMDGRLQVVVRDRHSHILNLEADGALVGEHVEYDEPRRLWRRSVWRLDPAGLTVFEADEYIPTAGVEVAGERIVVETTEEPPRQIRVVGWRDGERRVIAGGEAGDVDGIGDAARFSGINALVRGSDGTSVVVTDGARVRRITLDGQVVTLARAEMERIRRGPHPRLLGLAVEGEDVYVADYDHHQVRRITGAGRLDTVLHSGPWWSPAAVAVANGRLYVVEDRPESLLYLLSLVSGPRLRIVDADGTTLVVATAWRPGVIAGAAALLATALLFLWRFRPRRRGTRARPGLKPHLQI